MKHFIVFGIYLILLFYVGIGYPSTATASTKNVAYTENSTAFAMRFQQAVKRRNLSLIKGYLAYPVPVYDLGRKGTLEVPLIDVSKESYPDWMTPYLYKLIEETPPEKLVKMLDIRKDSSGKYLVHNLLFAADSQDYKYAKYSIMSAKALYHVLAVLHKGASEHCAKCVAKVIEYPIWECIGGKSVKIKNEAEFLKHYDEIVTPEVKDLMLHAWERHNWTGFPEQGVMLGSVGDIWIGSFGHKDAQGFYVWETKVWALREVGSCPAR